MEVFRTVDEVRRGRRGVNGALAFVPTMGALHAGHLEHVAVSRERVGAEGAVWVSVFVNPTQFGPNEDYERYPRPVEEDLAKCEASGVDAVFLPEVAEVYTPGSVAAAVDVPALTGVLEGARRPGHFAGVCRVVMKLLQIVGPTFMTLGRKDYQQLRVCSAMITDLFVPTHVVEVETVREPDGLAMSSRNAYLSEHDREQAVGMIRGLREAERLLHGGERSAGVLASVVQRAMVEHGFELDYAVVRDAVTLGEIDRVSDQAIALAAGRRGGVRLIDNLLLRA